MQLTQYTDFSLRTLVYLAIQPERETLCRIAEITEVFGISSNHVSKFIHHLGKLGYLQTVRGKNGGFKLAVKPVDINIGKVVRQLENTLQPIDCGLGPCVFLPACKLKGALTEAVNAYLAVLDKYSLADIITNKSDLRACIATIPTVVALL